MSIVGTIIRGTTPTIKYTFKKIAVGTGLTSSYSNGVLTISLA